LDESDSNAASARRRTSRRAEAVAVGLDAAGVEIDPRGRARAQVPHEDARMPLVSPGTRFEAADANAIRVPLPGIATSPGSVAVLPTTPPLETSSRIVWAGAADALAAIGPTAVRSTATHPAARRTRIWRLPRS